MSGKLEAASPTVNAFRPGTRCEDGVEVDAVKACHSCGTVWGEQHEPGRNEACLKCGADMHCCLNCRLYDPIKSGRCSSRATDPPSNKAGNNSCDEFQMADRAAGGRTADDRRRELDEKWNRLFKK